MKSDSHTSEKQKPQSGRQGDERPPDRVREAARTFIKKLRQGDPTLVPAADSCDDHKRNGRSQIISAEQAGDRPVKDIPEATRRFIKKLRESGYEPPVVTLAEMGSDSSKVHNQTPAQQSSSTAAKKVHDATQLYIKALREAGYEPPKVTLVEKGSNSSGKQSTQSLEQAVRRPLDNIHATALTFIKEVKQSDPKQHETAEVALEEKCAKTDEHIAVSKCAAESSKTTTPSSSLPPSDSPLTKVFAGQYLSSLVQETVTYRKISYKRLAQEMSMSETILREAVQGKLARTRGQWVRLGLLLGLPTNFELRPGEWDGAPCWEVCYPPVSVELDKA
jgi:hypothetical protein